MRDKIKELLTANYPDIDFESSTELVDSGVLSSFIVVNIISLFTVEFGVTIPYEEIIPENFNSLDAMASLVEKLQ
ncbi:MAG: acyl carrier protein [Lachnospiraceae bacterium]|nr:acyl carrier protein [Lachnospiraceae bacterium]